MRYHFLMLASLISALVLGISAQAVDFAVEDTTQRAKVQWDKSYVPTDAPETADLPDTEQAGPRYAQMGLTFQMSLPPVTPPPSPDAYPYYYYQGYYIPGDYSREGFVTERGNWWIGNQPYLPYYGYNPPTTDGYYPPYAFGGSSYGYGGYSSNYGQIVPAPPLASPPAYIPAFTMPVAPPPLRIRMSRGQIITERDPRFQLFFVPQPPNYLTTGSAIYQTPSPYYPPYYAPYPPFPPFPFPPR